MKLASVLLVVATLAPAFGQQASSETDREVRERTERYLDALERRDAKALDDLLVEECLLFYPRGVVDTKATLLEAMRKPDAASGQTQSKCTLSDVKVRHAGDTAVLTATLTVKRGDAPGISSKRTLTWARLDGRWLLMHDQWALVGDAAEAEYWSGYFRGNNQNFNRKPNSLLVQSIKGLRPGRALDVGMGEGRNAIYLAKQGWEVTGIDRAEDALAMARQQANQQGVKIAPVLQSAEEFDWGQERWDLVALLYVPAVRGNVTKIRESLKPGGLVVVEAFSKPSGSPGRGVEYESGELRKMFDKGFKILRYDETEGTADYGQKPARLVRLVGCKTTT